MGLRRISAAEAASYVKNGYNVGLGGFTPAGTPKAVTAEIGKMAHELHAQGFNCAQSVAMPFCEDLGADLLTVSRRSVFYF